MLFNTPEFILFFILVLFITHTLNAFNLVKTRNLFLLIASYTFYSNLNILYTLLLIYITIVNYIGGNFIYNTSNVTKNKRVISITIFLSLLPLFILKYAPIYTKNLWLPIGLSFFTFQALTYSIDIYRKKIDKCFSYTELSLFISFFPTLLSGPIERARNLIPQLQKKLEFNKECIILGAQWFIWGLFKKIVIADRLAELVNTNYANYGSATGGTLALTAIIYSFQIYYDFSGYATMAKGVGKMLGINLTENFHFPYFASSIKDFWRRWHISLTSWFTEYVYISLGGNRVSKPKWIFNIGVIFILSGIWHGAAWAFVIWGTIHGLLYLVEYFAKIKDKWGIYRIVVFVTVTLAWIFFRTADFTVATEIIAKIFTGPWLPVSHGAKLAPIAAVTGSLLILTLLIEVLMYRKIVPHQWQIKSCGFICLIILISLFAVSSDQFVYFKF